MAKNNTIHVRLTEEQMAFIERKKEEGGHISDSEIMREALRDLQIKYEQQEAQLEVIRASCLKAMDELKDGKGIAITNEGDLDAFAEKIKKQGRKALAAHNTK